MIDLKNFEIWFVTGSQFLYGEETLNTVNQHSKEIVQELGGSPVLPLKIVFKPVLKTPEEIFSICQEANNSKNCIGIIAWMHTFSPAKMWIGGLKILQKPLLHLHTQFNRDIPWKDIDMDFMNLNQSAHGDREFWFHHVAYAIESESCCRSLEGQECSRPHRSMDACGCRLE